MPATAKHRAGWVIVGYVVLIVVVALVSMPAAAIVGQAVRPVVVRLACGVVIAVLLLHLRKSLVRRIDGDEHAASSEAPRAALPALTPVLDRAFIDAHETVKWSIRSQRYFEAGTPATVARTRAA